MMKTKIHILAFNVCFFRDFAKPMHPNQFFKLITLFLVYVVASPTASDAQSVPEWVFKNEKDNVKVYYRKTSDIYEIKLTTSIQTSLTGLIQLFSEVENYPLWGYNITETKALKKVSDTEMYYYARIDFPWPMNDRDVIMHTHLEQNPVTKAVVSKSNSIYDYMAVKKDVVRMPVTRTTWTMIPGKNGWLYIEYHLYSDPGGSIPDWAVNMALDMGPRESIKGIRKLLSQPQYQSARLAYIKE